MGLKCNLLILVLAIGLSSAASSSNDVLTEQKGSVNAKAKCDSSYSLMCLKLDILSLIDKISTTNKEFSIASGVTLVRENNPNKTQNSKIVSGKAWLISWWKFHFLKLNVSIHRNGSSFPRQSRKEIKRIFDRQDSGLPAILHFEA